MPDTKTRRRSSPRETTSFSRSSFWQPSPEGCLPAITCSSPNTTKSLVQLIFSHSSSQEKRRVCACSEIRITEADAIIFGTPTYMGGPSAQFKVFSDASSDVWFGKLSPCRISNLNSRAECSCGKVILAFPFDQASLGGRACG